MFIPISQGTFIKLTGQIGTEIVWRRKDGSSWLLPDGRVAFEYWPGSGVAWQYVLVNA